MFAPQDVCLVRCPLDWNGSVRTLQSRIIHVIAIRSTLIVATVTKIIPIMIIVGIVLSACLLRLLYYMSTSEA